MLDFKKTYFLPFKYKIPNYTNRYINSTPYLFRLFKFIKRELFIYLMGQKSNEVFSISEECEKILWINLSAPSLGDSLMDLSSRVLLKHKKIDLFTSEKNAAIYEADLIFSSVFTSNNKQKFPKYDLIILDSFSTNSIRLKSKIAHKTPYVSMFGHFNGPEVNRVLFSFHRMNKLIGYRKTENQINLMASCEMKISDHDQKLIKLIDLPEKFIAIALGGEWSYRSYDKWLKVIQELVLNERSLNIVLIGSKNANSDLNIIKNKFDQTNLFDCVAKYTFSQTAQIISKARLLICCDGGLMHAANALNVTTIALFARLKPEMQLTKKNNVFPLYDSSNVSNISYQDIIKVYSKNVGVKFDHNHRLDG